MIVACVLRSGGDFGPDWVRALHSGLREHSPELDLVVLTDMVDEPMPGYIRPLKHDWPGWWSKVELFRPGQFDDTVLYLDLDTLVLGDVGLYADFYGQVAFLADLLQPARRIGSGVVLFDGTNPPPFYEKFVERPHKIMQRHSTRSDLWYQEVSGRYDLIQDRYPGSVVSFKRHCRDAKPDGPTLVCFHGQPRPNDPAAGWGYGYWSLRAEGKTALRIPDEPEQDQREAA